MRPKLYENKIGQYVPAEWDGRNTSGIRLFGDEVLILPDTVPQTTKGGILLTSDSQEKHELAAITGTLITMGPDAFTWNRTRTKPFTGERPKIGTRVIFDKYAGTAIPAAADGRRYVVMSDFSVAGEFEPSEDSSNG